MIRRERERKGQKIKTVLTLSRYLISLHDLQSLLEKIMDCIMEIFNAERGLLMLYPENNETGPACKAGRIVSGDQTHRNSFQVNKRVLSRVTREKKCFTIFDASSDEDLKGRSDIIREGIKSILCGPIMIHGKILGIIYLDSSLWTGLFTKEDLEILELISNQTGLFIENAGLSQRLHRGALENEASRDKLNKWNRVLEQSIIERDRSSSEADPELKAMFEKLDQYAVAVEELAINEERNRFAIDLHDILGNTLALLVKQLESCVITCRGAPEITEQKLLEAIRISREGITDLKRAIFRLAPEKLETNRLITGLASLFREFQTLGMKIDFSVEGICDDWDPAYSLVIYQICREALTNSLRHGQAKNVTVILKFTERKIRLIIIDDGHGCKKIIKGFGLMGMEQRIASLHGNISFSSDGESEFMIRLELPVGGNDDYPGG